MKIIAFVLSVILALVLGFIMAVVFALHYTREEMENEETKGFHR